jgi:uncharacterized protein (DUF736 family)
MDDAVACSAMASAQFFPRRPADGFLAPASLQKTAPPPSAASLRPSGAAVAGSSPSVSIEAAMVRLSSDKETLTMATIGTFTKNETGFTGQIQTLGVKAKASISPVEKTGDTAPDYRVFAGKVEIGAGWVRKSKNDREYVSVKLDDPSFAAPIYANLVEVDGQHELIWSRQ